MGITVPLVSSRVNGANFPRVPLLVDRVERSSMVGEAREARGWNEGEDRTRIARESRSPRYEIVGTFEPTDRRKTLF